MTSLSLIEQLQFAVARLETERDDGKHFYSTGFFYEVPYKSDSERRQVFIVTNRHAIEGKKKVCFYLSQGEEGNKAPKYCSPLRHEISIDAIPVIYHPDPQIDLCAIPITVFINVRNQLNRHVFYRTFGENMLPSPSDLASFDAVEDIMMVGYPNGLWDEHHNLPIFRRGISATPIAVGFNGKKEFIIDAACYKGSSGSPVMICDIGRVRDKFGGMTIGSSRIFLIGVLYGAPVVTMEGDIVIDNHPELKTDAKAKTYAPINLGLVVNHQALRELTDVIRIKLNID